MPAHGLLVRVGIDSACGRWNAPSDFDSRSFAYVPIPESKKQRSWLSTGYHEFTKSVHLLSNSLPVALQREPAHLDPDFRYL